MAVEVILHILMAHHIHNTCIYNIYASLTHIIISVKSTATQSACN